MPKFDKRYFFSSRYLTASVAHQCCRCLAPIQVGETYLKFVPFQWEHNDVCVGCSVLKHPDGTLIWPCSAVKDRMRELGDAAGHQAQASLAL